jgi:AP2-associated kinase
VYGTTHHVLKRIAVPNESMLKEVKKEVDIMVRRLSCLEWCISNGPQRILKGHPNIVHLVDAAWNRTSTGVYEVFILMEYCPG